MENRLFAVKHQQRVVLLAVDLLRPLLHFLLLARTNGLSCFIQLLRTETYVCS